MANRRNYFFRQKVTELELDEGFDDLEDADRNLALDIKVTGVVSGMAVAQRAAGANLTVDVSAGTAYDKAGQRIQFSSTQNVDVSIDENGTSTSVAGAGNSKVISVFAKFRRALTDPRTDGNAATVYFSEAESFTFVVRQSPEAVTPSAVPLDAEYILLADITRAYGATTITNAMIDASATNRREEAVKVSGTPHRVQRGRFLDAIADVLGWVNTNENTLSGHIGAASNAHAATAISYAGGAFVGAGTVEAAIDGVQTALQATTGGALVGAAATAATYMFGLATATVQAQINEIRSYLDLGTKGRRVQVINTATTLAAATHRDVNVDTSAGAVTLTLPTPTLGLEFRIKDSKGTFGTNACTLARAGTEKIEGLAASLILSADWGAYTIYSDGTDWFIR